MDPLLRVSIEKHISRILSQNVLDNANEVFSKLVYPITKNIDDVLLGYVIGRTIEFAFSSFQILNQRMPTDGEFIEICRVIERRVIEIRSQITSTRNK